MRDSGKKNKLGETGFSIIEVAVATGIVATAFVTLMSLFAYNFRVEILNRNRITAAYLAQEALEMVKQKRDTNWFDGSDATDWNYGLNVGTGLIMSAVNKDDPAQGWTLDNGGGAGDSKNNIYLYQGHYVQTKSSVVGMTDTGLRRTVDVSITDPTYMIVTVHMKLNSSSTDLVTITTRLYDKWNG
jgi:type II secretory pathway pseudopilin PulG